MKKSIEVSSLKKFDGAEGNSRGRCKDGGIDNTSGVVYQNNLVVILIHADISETRIEDSRLINKETFYKPEVD